MGPSLLEQGRAPVLTSGLAPSVSDHIEYSDGPPGFPSRRRPATDETTRHTAVIGEAPPGSQIRALVQLHLSLVKRPQQRKQPRTERPPGAVARLVLAQGNGAAHDLGLLPDLRVLLQERAGEDDDLGAQSAATGLDRSDGNL